MTSPTPVPLSESTEQYYHPWARRVKEVLGSNSSTFRYAVRLSATGLAIEAQSPDTGIWQPIMLPNTGTQFASEADRLLVYEMVTGVREIPVAVTAPTETT